jgi:hypothetical protein
MGKKRHVWIFTDDRGRKRSVLMSYRTYMELLEDLADLQTIADRQDQPRVSLEKVIADLKDAGRIRVCGERA